MSGLFGATAAPRVAPALLCANPDEHSAWPPFLQVHESLVTAESYMAWLQASYPSIPADKAQMMADQLASVPPSLGGLSTRCNKLASGRVALVGDAGHSVW